MAVRRSRRRRGLSFFQISLITAGLGIALLVGGVGVFFLDQASRREPLDIELYPSAIPYTDQQINPTRLKTFYRVLDADTDQVATFYQERMREHYSDVTDTAAPTCVRVPEIGEADVEPGIVPFFYRCMFDRSGFFSSQWTQVTIFPGVFNENPDLNTEGETLIEYEQYWTPS